MQESVTTTAVPGSAFQHGRSQRIAWAVLLIAFLVFCFLCVFTGVGINYFLFKSTVPMQVSLDVGRGTASYIGTDLVEKVVPRDVHYVSNNERISTDVQSQASLFVQDSYYGRLIAVITMKNGTTLNMNYSDRPRFEFSSVDYRVDLTNVTGELDVHIPVSLPRSVWISLQLTSGAFVYLTASGEYTVITSATQVQVFNRTSGHAILISPDRTPRDIPSGQKAVMTVTDTGADIALMSTPVDLLQDSQIQTMSPDAINGSTALLADLVQPWQCGDIQSDPPGEYSIGMPEGRPAVRLYRDGGATNHGETFCQEFVGPGQPGLDVSKYKDLRLKAVFDIESQSVTGCGSQGSECPLMLQIDYTYKNDKGVEAPAIWYHGFYTNYDVQSLYPLRCLSCLLEHEAVYAHEWYVYESSNLLDLMPDTQQPYAILRIRVYASGHEYDTYISDLALYAS